MPSLREALKMVNKVGFRTLRTFRASLVQEIFLDFNNFLSASLNFPIVRCIFLWRIKSVQNNKRYVVNTNFALLANLLSVTSREFSLSWLFVNFRVSLQQSWNEGKQIILEHKVRSPFCKKRAKRIITFFFLSTIIHKNNSQYWIVKDVKDVKDVVSCISY